MDLLVKLYDLQDSDFITNIGDKNLRLIRAMTPNKTEIKSFISQFSSKWGDEVETAFSSHPVSCFIVVNENKEIVGVAGYNCTMKGFFGPMGVDERFRGNGIGTALIKKCCFSLKEEGFGYAIIGSSSQKAIPLYKRSVNATEIEGSEKSIYQNLL